MELTPDPYLRTLIPEKLRTETSVRGHSGFKGPAPDLDPLLPASQPQTSLAFVVLDVHSSLSL